MYCLVILQSTTLMTMHTRRFLGCCCSQNSWSYRRKILETGFHSSGNKTGSWSNGYRACISDHKTGTLSNKHWWQSSQCLRHASILQAFRTITLSPVLFKLQERVILWHMQHVTLTWQTILVRDSLVLRGETPLRLPYIRRPGPQSPLSGRAPPQGAHFSRIYCFYTEKPWISRAT